jgi:hypothetical protein
MRTLKAWLVVILVWVALAAMAFWTAFDPEPCHTDTECGCTLDCLE